MPHPDPEVQRHIERLTDYANGLLDAGTAPSQVISLVMAKGLDYETAAKFVNALLAVRAERTGCNGRQDKPPDYYEVLQVSPNADLDVIQAAYKRLALKYHPDRNRDPEAEQKMRLLNDAYATLSDPDRRRAYDAARKQGTGANGPQATGAQQPSPETLREIQELNQYVNLLLDRGEPLAAVVQCIMAKGLDRQLAGDVLRAVLANRSAMAFPAAGGPKPSRQVQEKHIQQVTEYANLLLDWGESVATIMKQLNEIGVDFEPANNLINHLLADRARRARHPQRQPADSQDDGLATLLSALQAIFPPVKPVLQPVLYGGGVAAMTVFIAFRPGAPALMYLLLPLVCTTIGGVVVLFRSHQQYRKPGPGPQNQATAPAPQWASLPASERAGLMGRWALFVLLWLLGSVGPFVGYETGRSSATAGAEEMVNHTKQARRFASNREYDKALREYTQAIYLIEKQLSAAQSPEAKAALARVYYERGNVYSLAMKDWERAIADYSQAIHLDNRLAEAYLDRSVAHFAKGDAAQAKTDYQEAIRIKPELAKPRQP